MNVYAQCPEVSGRRYALRLVREKDCEDLLKVYSDAEAVPLFNSDNCNGDDFHYTTLERMREAIDFWLWSYANGWFVRWSILDRETDSAIGTVELFRQEYDHGRRARAVLRLDLRSDYEREEAVADILSLVFPSAFEWFGCDTAITKAKPIALQRRKALASLGFTDSEETVTGNDGTVYSDYASLRRKP